MEFSICLSIQVLLYMTLAGTNNLQCPDHSQWNLRFRAFCKNSSMWYYCLFDKNSLQYKEVCSNQESFHKPGFKYIISGNLNGEPCDKKRFQPFKFSMDGNSECVFLKSTCIEDGQILHSNGTTKTDITCRCDYTRGYAFVNIPKHTCYCDPTHEDCSCYKKPCGENEVLTADYECIKQLQWYKDMHCPLIEKMRLKDNKTSDVKFKSTVNLKSIQDTTGFNVHTHTAQLVILIIFLSMTVIFSCFLLFGIRCFEKCRNFIRMEETILNKVEEGITQYKLSLTTEKPYCAPDEEEFRRTDLTDIHNQHINDWNKDDEKFIVTKATNAIYERLMRDSCVLVVGRAGNGKSSIVRHIALRLRSKEYYQVIPIVRGPDCVFKFVYRNPKQLFVVDDFCGKVNINAQSVDVWFSQIEEILKMICTIGKVRGKQISEVKFLFVTRLDIYTDRIFEKLDLLMKYVCILSEWPLSDDEKLKMIKKYIPIEVETKLCETLTSDKAYFPLLCKLAEKKTADQIVKLFSNLDDFIKQDILDLKNTNNLQFCIITLCALLNNKFKEDILNEVYESGFERAAFETICVEFNLGCNKDIVKCRIKEQLDNLQGTYVAKTENYYHFIHTKVYHIAVLVCGQIFLHTFIKFVRSSFIAEKFCFKSVQTDNKTDAIMIDDLDAEKRYFDRLMDDLEQGDTYSSFHNSQLQNAAYREKFHWYCRLRKQKLSDVLKHIFVNRDTIDENDYEDYIGFTQQHHFFSNKMRKPLIETAWEGYEDIIQMLLDLGCDINATDKFGRTALFVACMLGKSKVVEVLLNNKADHSLGDKYERSPLFVASREGYDAIVYALLEHNADVNQCDVNGDSPVLIASSEGNLLIVKTLSQKVQKFSQCNMQGETAVFLASMNGRTNVVKYLVASYFSICISLTDVNGKSPLFIACKEGHYPVVQVLLEYHADISQCDWNNRSPLFIACAVGNSAIVKALIQNNANINQCDEEDTTPIFIASEKGRSDIVKILIDNNADLNIADNKKRTPLYAASMRGFVDIVTLLHENGASISQFNKWGGSPLFVASQEGHCDVVKYLIEMRADISYPDMNGTTPLIVACEMGHFETVKILINSGANINESDCNKKTPLQAATDGGYTVIVETLIKKGAF